MHRTLGRVVLAVGVVAILVVLHDGLRRQRLAPDGVEREHAGELVQAARQRGAFALGAGGRTEQGHGQIVAGLARLAPNLVR